MAKPNTAHQIMAHLAQISVASAAEIAVAIGCERSIVARCLHGELKEQVKQNSKYQWSLRDSGDRSGSVAKSGPLTNTELSRLARYYLACMGQSDVGVSALAHSPQKESDYTELSELPCDGDDFLSQEAAQHMLGKVRSEKGRWELYLGYPTSLRSGKSQRTGKEYFTIEPLLLFPVDLGNVGDLPELNLGFPILNQNAIRAFTNVDRDQVMDTLIQLESELGITKQKQMVPIDELSRRLRVMRPEWPWNEYIDPDQLAIEPPLHSIRVPGIYNRAVVLMAERSPFTQGLESELKELAQLSKSDYVDTVLENWIGGEFPEQESISENDLIEVLPMNLEQREAVASALSKPLTIITGPPGTGKSQVVTNLMLNAAWHGKKVLFASKNNQAVDVVENRVNGLGDRSFLLRVGAQQYQTRLAEFLMEFQSAIGSQEDKEQFEATLKQNDALKQGLERVDRSVANLVRVRNEVDRLEQQAEASRQVLPEDTLSMLESLDLNAVIAAHLAFSDSLLKADRAGESFFSRVLTPIRLRGAGRLAENLIAKVGWLGVEAPSSKVLWSNISVWHDYSTRVGEMLSSTMDLRDYQVALGTLQQSPSLESLDRKRLKLLEDVAINSRTLWKLWLKLEPAKIDNSARQLLNRYTSVLKMVIDAGSQSRLSPSVYAQYQKLSGEVAHLLPCWAATSLSMRGKIPFEAGFFDLVVFDEASQCDIASALPLLYRAKHAVIIGDPNQLSHITGLQRGQDQQLLDKFALIENFPHWSYSTNSLFDLAAGMAGQDSVVRLLDHHRSHADIIQFSNDEFYEGRLRVATNYQNLKSLDDGGPGVYWFDVKGKASKPAAGGALNMIEAQGVIKALRRLVLGRGYEGSIGVVSPFRAQVNAIRRLLEQDIELAQALLDRSFLVDTVHSFQGDERDIMVFSPVYADGMSEGSRSFLGNNGNLFNVAVTRARAHVIVVGDMSACASGEISYLANFANYVRNLAEAEEESQMQAKDYGAVYPLVANPEHVSDWEKVLYGALYQAKVRPIPQYRVEKYLQDFAVFDGERKLNIEVDGELYHRNWTGELCRRDQLRNQRMFELGWDVIRFWVYEVRDDLPGCVARVQKWIDAA